MHADGQRACLGNPPNDCLWHIQPDLNDNNRRNRSAGTMRSERQLMWFPSRIPPTQAKKGASLASITKGIDDHRESRRGLAPARIEKVVAREYGRHQSSSTRLRRPLAICGCAMLSGT